MWGHYGFAGGRFLTSTDFGPVVDLLGIPDSVACVFLRVTNVVFQGAGCACPPADCVHVNETCARSALRTSHMPSFFFRDSFWGLKIAMILRLCGCFSPSAVSSCCPPTLRINYLPTNAAGVRAQFDTAAGGAAVPVLLAASRIIRLLINSTGERCRG